MYRIVIEPIKKTDIPDKVRWYNDPDINKFMHYEEEFSVEKSLVWLESIREDNTRFENVIRIIENDQVKNIGIIGLFNIDLKNKKAGFYITIGEKDYQGKGLAKKATVKFLKQCFEKYGLEKIYLFTDVDNISAQKLYQKVGFKREGLLRKELLYKDQFIDRYYYGILRDEYYELYSS